MDTIGFVGVYDKTDLLLNVAKILTYFDKKVLIIDSTVEQKARYIVPCISPTASYVTTYESIDVAVGFPSITALEQYMGTKEEWHYDIILVDTDTKSRMDEFKLREAKRNFFVTGFDMYSLKRGLEILADIKEPLNLTKVLFSKEMLVEEDEYLNYLSLGYKIQWDENKIYFPLENGDMSVLVENQRMQKIKFKKLSAQYKEGLAFIIQEILNNVNESIIRKTIKTIEKGG